MAKINTLLQSKDIKNVALGIALLKQDDPSAIRVRRIQKNNPYSSSFCVYVNNIKRFVIHVNGSGNNAVVDYTHKYKGGSASDRKFNHTIGALTPEQLAAVMGIISDHC